jgi:hypothetical protein
MAKSNDATNYKGSGMSKTAYVKKYGTTSGTYSATHGVNQGGKGKGSSGSGGNSYGDIVKNIMGATPAQQKVIKPFEDTYTPELEAEDYAQSEALYKPFYEKQIANELEDLNAWSEADSVSYDRSLRRARFSLAASGAAIGGDRTTVEGEMDTDHKAEVANQVRGVERLVGTDRIVNGGYQSAGQNQEGSIVGGMKAQIQEGQLWYKNQRAQRYNGNSQTYYSQPSPYALDGSSM